MRKPDVELARMVAVNSTDIKDTIDGLIEYIEDLPMNGEEYHDLAMRTAAGPEVFHREKIADIRTAGGAYYGGAYGQEAIIDAIVNFIDAARMLSNIKATLFYGKDFVLPTKYESKDVLRFHTDNFHNYQMLHAILGICSESGELMEDVVTLNRLPDDADISDPMERINNAHQRLEVTQNAKREMGDIDWYQELFAHAIGTSVDTMRKANIHRLRKRFPEKFSEDDAIARADED